MPCSYLDSGSVPNRDSFARFWRDRISNFADLLPKADGTANGEEGTYPDYPYQANYIKGLRRLDANLGDDADPETYCDYLGILREGRLRVSNRFDRIELQGDKPVPLELDCDSVLPQPLKGMPPPRKQTNPQGGLPVSTTGPDPSGVNLNLFRNITRSLRPAPRIDGVAPAGGVTLPHENTAEMVELYWMALLRDLPFRSWILPTDVERRFPNPPPSWEQLEDDGATIDTAVRDLNIAQEYFAEAYPVGGGEVTTGNIFRGAADGDRFGPFISQFLLRGNTVRCARGTGISNHPRDGVIPEGSIPNSQKQTTVTGYVDFLRRRNEWRCVEQGYVDPSGTDPLECEGSRFIRHLRDLGNWVHLDDPAQHFRNAALLMLNEPALQPPSLTEDEVVAVPGRGALDSFSFGAEQSGKADMDPCPPSGRPFPFDMCNPYVPVVNGGNPDARNQTGFVTFGPEQVLDGIGEVTDLALRAAWWQKWFVHRRLRPEEFGGLVDARLDDKPRPYQIDPLLTEKFGDLLKLVVTRNRFEDFVFKGKGGTVSGVGEKEQSYLLPQLFPEGSPTHPSYPSGHATIAGACATLLKAFFNTECPMTDPAASDEPDPTRLPPAYVASDDGMQLIKAAENDRVLTVGGELDKLASNISIGRNAAGVHWRSDATQGMELGEAVATYFLYELAWALNEESFCFTFRRFFQNEQITIIRQTEYNPGRMVRRVKTQIQRLDKNGRAEGDPEDLVRSDAEDHP
ncbi:MAG: vanadium-dependent haloperoxidase [Aridibacter sp.]